MRPGGGAFPDGRRGRDPGRGAAELARTYLDQAELLIAQGGTSHRSRTVELLREAGAIFLDFGMQPFVHRSARLAQELGVSIPTTPPGRSAYPDDLSDREVDVLVQMTRGRTREEIAADLVLRQQTVAGHLASIFDKTRVSDEATAASYAGEKGLAGPVDRRRRSALEERDDKSGSRAPNHPGERHRRSRRADQPLGGHEGATPVPDRQRGHPRVSGRAPRG